MAVMEKGGVPLHLHLKRVPLIFAALTSVGVASPDMTITSSIGRTIFL